MVSSPDGPFINLARLNLSKYAARPDLAKSLFEYIFYNENDVRTVCIHFFICTHIVSLYPKCTIVIARLAYLLLPGDLIKYLPYKMLLIYTNRPMQKFSQLL